MWASVSRNKTLAAATVSQAPRFQGMHQRVHDYVFRTFPNPNTKIGEWIQIRDRRGEPLNKVVALPVKDPYHVLQNLILCVEILHTKGQTIDYAPVGRLEN